MNYDQYIKELKKVVNKGKILTVINVIMLLMNTLLLISRLAM